LDVALIRGCPNIALRDYARSASVVLGVSVSAGVVLTISFASLRAVYVGVEKLLEGIGDCPAWAKFLLAAGLVVAIAHPKSRAKLVEAWSWVRSTAEDIRPGLMNVIETIAIQLLESQQKAAAHHAELEAALPSPRPRTAIQHARSILLLSKAPALDRGNRSTHAH
jgi:hypothetical protein